MFIKKTHSRNNKGFTLIELLVVVAIIGLLSSVVLASLNSARAKAREARRKSDIHALEVAIQSYYIDHNGVFPANDGTSSGDWSASFKSSLAPYLPQVPKDPIVPNGYPVPNFYYMAGIDGSGVGWGQDGSKRGISPCTDHYFLWFILENPINNNPDTYAPCWSPTGAGKYIYVRDLGKP